MSQIRQIRQVLIIPVVPKEDTCSSSHEYLYRVATLRSKIIFASKYNIYSTATVYTEINYYQYTQTQIQQSLLQNVTKSSPLKMEKIHFFFTKVLETCCLLNLNLNLCISVAQLPYTTTALKSICLIDEKLQCRKKPYKLRFLCE